MDINPKRTFVVIGLAAMLSGGILYYQEASYSPSAEQEARDAVEKAKKGGKAEIVPKPKSGGAGGVVPPVAKSGPSPSPATGGGLFASGGGFDDEVGPEMARALKKRAEQSGGSGGGPGRKSGNSGSGSGAGGGGSSGGSGGGSSGGSSGGGSSGGESSGGSGGGGDQGPDPDEESGYWLDDGTNIRHNSSCEFYKAEEGAPSGPDDGVACRRCGG